MAHRYLDSEESRCHNATLCHPCTEGERLCFSPADEKFHDCDKVGSLIESGQNFPESFTVDGVERLS